MRLHVEDTSSRILQIRVNQQKRILCRTSSLHTKTCTRHPPTVEARTISPLLLTLELSFNKMYNSIIAHNSSEDPLNPSLFQWGERERECSLPPHLLITPPLLSWNFYPWLPLQSTSLIHAHFHGDGSICYILCVGTAAKQQMLMLLLFSR